MGILDLFKRRPERPAAPVAEQQPETPVAPVKAKRDYKSKPGHYKPRREYVRVDNIARAAGVKAVDVLNIVTENDGKIVRYKHGRLYLTAADAVYIHGKIWEQ